MLTDKHYEWRACWLINHWKTSFLTDRLHKWRACWLTNFLKCKHADWRPDAGDVGVLRDVPQPFQHGTFLAKDWRQLLPSAAVLPRAKNSNRVWDAKFRLGWCVRLVCRFVRQKKRFGENMRYCGLLCACTWSDWKIWACFFMFFVS